MVSECVACVFLLLLWHGNMYRLCLPAYLLLLSSSSSSSFATRHYKLNGEMWCASMRRVTLFILKIFIKFFCGTIFVAVQRCAWTHKLGECLCHQCTSVSSLCVFCFTLIPKLDDGRYGKCNALWLWTSEIVQFQVDGCRNRFAFTDRLCVCASIYVCTCVVYMKAIFGRLNGIRLRALGIVMGGRNSSDYFIRIQNRFQNDRWRTASSNSHSKWFSCMPFVCFCIICVLRSRINNIAFMRGQLTHRHTLTFELRPISFHVQPINFEWRRCVYIEEWRWEAVNCVECLLMPILHHLHICEYFRLYWSMYENQIMTFVRFC